MDANAGATRKPGRAKQDAKQAHAFAFERKLASKAHQKAETEQLNRQNRRTVLDRHHDRARVVQHRVDLNWTSTTQLTSRSSQLARRRYEDASMRSIGLGCM